VNPPAQRNERPHAIAWVSPVQVIVRLREFGGFGRGLYVVALKTPSDTESRPPVFPAHSVVHLARMIMDSSCSKYSGSGLRRRESKKRRPTVLPAHSVHLARHHGLELLKVLRISTPTP
jgi:hypothetical protein